MAAAAAAAVSAGVFAFFALSFGLSHASRLAWEYWEQHKLLGWEVLQRWFYSPTALYGCREPTVHLLSSTSLGTLCAVRCALCPALFETALGEGVGVWGAGLS
jgi:hypothetical protein